MSGEAANLGRGGRVSRAGTAYQQIKSAILSGELTASDVLHEEKLAERLGMSRTPVREALRRLAEDNLVEIVPGRGTWVSDVSLTDLREIFDLRKVLECLAAEQAVSRVPDAEIAENERGWLDIEDALKRGERVSYVVVSRLDNALHNLIVGWCTNQRLKDFVRLLNEEIMRYQLITAQTLADVEETVSQHLHLIALLKARDGEALSTALRAHVERSEEIVFSRR